MTMISAMILIPAMAVIPAMVITSDGNDTTILLILAMAVIPAIVITSDGNDTSNSVVKPRGTASSRGTFLMSWSWGLMTRS